MSRCAFRSSALVGLLLLLPLAARGQQPVGSEFQVNTYVTGSQGGANVARHPDGSFIVVWASPNQDGSQFGAFAQIYDGSGATVGGEFRVNSYITGNQFAPAAAPAANGEFVVVWESVGQDGSVSGIFGRRIQANGAPLGTEFRVNTYTTGIQNRTRVAAASQGSFVVVWESYQEGSEMGVFGQCFGAAGVPTGAEFRVNSYTTGYQYFSDVAMSASGSFAVVWMDWPRRNSYAQRYAADCTPTGVEFQAHSGLLPAIAMDSPGNFVVAGLQSGAGVYDISVQRFNSGGAALGTEFKVNTYTPDLQDFPAIAMEPGGDFVVTWHTYNLTTFLFDDVSARFFRANGTPTGPEFRVNTYTTGSQSSSAAGMDGEGNFVVTWTSPDGSGYGVKAQHFVWPDLIFADGFNAGP